MELRIVQLRNGGSCAIILKPIFSPTEQERIKRFTAPNIECGGEFGGDGDDPFTLPTITKKLNQFPYTQSFDGLTLGHDVARTRAITYQEEMEDRIETAWTTFMALNNTFEGEKVRTI